MTIAKGIIATVMLLVVIVLVYTANTAWAQDKKETPPKMSAEDSAELNDLARQSLQVYIQLKNVQQKYDDARNADPQWVDLSRQNNDIGQKFQTAINRVQDKIDKDRKTWVIDPSKMEVVHPAPPAATATPEKK